MKKRFVYLILFIFIFSLLLIGCSKGNLGKSNPSEEESFDRLTLDWYVQNMSKDPLTCHFSLTNPNSYGITPKEDGFPEFSEKAYVKTCTEQKNFYKDLKRISRDNLPVKKQLTYDILCHYYSLQNQYDRYYYYADPLSPTSGIPSSLPALLCAYEFHNEKDIKTYFSLLDDMDIYFEQLALFATEKKEKNLLDNDLCLKESADFCEKFGKTSSDHMLLSSFDNRIKSCTFLAENQKQKYKSRNKSLVQDVVLPSYLSLSTRLLSIYASTDTYSSRNSAPRSQQYYCLLTKSATGTEDSPFLVFQQIDKKRRYDLTQLGKLFTSRPYLATMLSSQDCALKEPEEMISYLKESMKDDFPSMPSVNLDIQRIPPELQDNSAPAFYLIAPIDNWKDNHVFYNPHSFSNHLGLFTTMAHEGFPGHLYQTCMSYSYGYEPVRQLLSYPGYVEGWATYVEQESYLYAGLPADVSQALAINQSVILSLYASADIGVNFYGWNESALLDFLKDYGIDNKKTVSEIYQLVVSDPANYLKYYVGYLNFLDLREKCEEKYPRDFSPMDFHKCILQTGPAPFSILEEELDDYFSKSA